MDGKGRSRRREKGGRSQERRKGPGIEPGPLRFVGHGPEMAKAPVWGATLGGSLETGAFVSWEGEPPIRHGSERTSASQRPPPCPNSMRGDTATVKPQVCLILARPGVVLLLPVLRFQVLSSLVPRSLFSGSLFRQLWPLRNLHGWTRDGMNRGPSSLVQGENTLNLITCASPCLLPSPPNS